MRLGVRVRFRGDWAFVFVFPAVGVCGSGRYLGSLVYLSLGWTFRSLRALLAFLQGSPASPTAYWRANRLCRRLERGSPCGVTSQNSPRAGRQQGYAGSGGCVGSPRLKRPARAQPPLGRATARRQYLSLCGPGAMMPWRGRLPEFVASAVPQPYFSSCT